MLSTLKGIFGRTAPTEQKKGALAVVDEYDEEIPRYPPFAKGLPVAPIDKVVATQDELVERIRNALGFNREQHQELILPVIHRYAEFVHLLPASEAHHHRGAGGLFRHGLEVAFWAAQASEAVIFSMEGSPRERRNNEPRWRLASCFSGLLHDVGKPLSDVSVTDKDGSVTWNPYANTLYGWAAHHKIDRYFLRWRDNRHKRHEQFSLLTIERIIPPNVLQYLSEAGPEILEAMLEAIAGTSTNQPVTKLMLKADQESVARDLKQSRLDVDEFSYGVPVERYVFDAIRRLVKTGKWKVNEAGARVWHLHQGVFITWRQLGDLYELISKDKIPGIPRDPDTLADILIERGFAIPNKVPGSNGESAHYRYWEVCPDVLQEGRPAGSVKLLGLRLESHELVFTTEPPAPVKAVIVGEREEPEIHFADLDGDTEGQQSASESADPDGDGEESGGEVQSGESRPSGLEDAYEVAASVPEIGADGANPLDGLMGGADGMDFPFDAFGMDQPAQDAPAAPAAPEEGSPASSQGDEMPPLVDEIPGSVPEDNSEPPFMDEPSFMDAPPMDPNSMMGSPEPPSPTGKPMPAMTDMFASTDETALDVSSLFPGQSPKGTGGGNSAKAAKKNGSPKPAEKGKAAPLKAAVQPAADGDKAPSPKVEKKQARAKLDAALRGLPSNVQKILEQAIFPVLSGEKLLGDVLCMFQGQAAILYPEGADALGGASEVLSSLWDAGAVAGDPVMPGKKIQTFKGMKGLVLAPGISSLVVDALNEAESSMEGIQDVLLGGAGGRKNKKAPKAGKKKPTSSEQGNRKAGGHDAQSSAAKQPEKKVHTEKAQTESVQPKQNSTPVRRPEKSVTPPPSRPEPKPAKKEVDIPEIEENTLLPKGRGQMTADFDDIKPKTMTVEAAIAQLKEMILKREGRWITSAVTKEGGFLVTSGKSLDIIAGEFADLSKHNLRGHLKRGQADPPMMYKQGKLYLVLKENNEA